MLSPDPALVDFYALMQPVGRIGEAKSGHRIHAEQSIPIRSLTARTEEPLAVQCVPVWLVAGCFVNSNVQGRPTMPRPSSLVPVPSVSWNWALMS